MISARIPLIIADVILIYITWSQLRCRDALNEIRQSKRLSLSNVLFRDGTSLDQYRYTTLGCWH